MAREEKFVQMCPVCGGKKFGFYKDDRATEPAGQEMYECYRCGNIFAFPLEVPRSEAHKLKEVPLTPRIVKDTPESAFIPVGKVEIGVYWRILGVVMTIFGIAYLIMAFLPVICYGDLGASQCEVNSAPQNYTFMGLSVMAAGFYMLIESYELSRKRFKQPWIMKMGLVLALLIITVYFGAGSITVFALP